MLGTLPSCQIHPGPCAALVSLPAIASCCSFIDKKGSADDIGLGLGVEEKSFRVTSEKLRDQWGHPLITFMGQVWFNEVIPLFLSPPIRTGIIEYFVRSHNLLSDVLTHSSFPLRDSLF